MAAFYLPPLVCGQRWSSPRTCFEAVTQKLSVLAIQAGELGPIHQIIAGLDVALWDLVARRAKQPLWRLLAPDSQVPPAIRLYASGINPTEPELLAAQKLEEGYRAFKLKAAVGGPGYVEVDANPNLLRDTFAGDAFRVADGCVSLQEEHGLGVEPDMAACRSYITFQNV